MDVTVKTPYGTLCGEQVEGFAHFLGVPYAAAPVGELRFRKPCPVIPWEGIRQTKRYGDFCPQSGNPGSMEKEAKASEDCLTLNIFTPACDEKRRPVVIWIHGGAYVTGCASEPNRQGGQMCIDADVVVVSIQYRLGAFGQVNFAALCEENLFDSNCGTWDQVAAVNWVVENIALFGGDPACITLMGESAGGSSVLTLITTPYLRGKIKRAVLGSPAPFLIHSPENGKLAAEEVLKNLNIPEAEVHRVRNLPAEQLVAAVKAAEENYVNVQPYLIPTGPVVDGDLIPEHPYDAVMHGAADGIQILIGTTADEGTMFARGKPGDIFPTTPQQLQIFWDAHPHMDRDRILKLYKTLPNIKLYQELGKEIVFHMPTVELASRLAQTGDVYMYRFDYAYPVMRMLGLGAVHCTDSVLIFGGERIGILKFYSLFSGRTGNGLAKEVHDRWCRFIATGDPNLTSEAAWPKYSDRQATFILDRKRTVSHAPAADLQKIYGTVRPYGN